MVVSCGPRFNQIEDGLFCGDMMTAWFVSLLSTCRLLRSSVGCPLVIRLSHLPRVHSVSPAGEDQFRLVVRECDCVQRTSVDIVFFALLVYYGLHQSGGFRVFAMDNTRVLLPSPSGANSSSAHHLFLLGCCLLKEKLAWPSPVPCPGHHEECCPTWIHWRTSFSNLFFVLPAVKPRGTFLSTPASISFFVSSLL